jgi:hypothetical protein
MTKGSCLCSGVCCRPDGYRLLTRRLASIDTAEMAESPHGAQSPWDVQSCQPVDSTVPLITQAGGRITRPAEGHFQPHWSGDEEACKSP